ncbi:MAG TPA: DUF393 domain-containing protein [Marmoricola sp.]|nr:DUF393 domain-containing protein [Marmoricola sp.]
MARVLLFDGDCPFCTLSARQLERLGCAVDMVPFQGYGDLAAHGLTERDVAAAVHLVDGDRVLVGHEALAGTLQHSRHAVLRLAGRVVGLPVLRPLGSRAYRFVSEHRDRLPGTTPACRADPASCGR